MSSKPKHKRFLVFVYGTLKQGHYNHALISNDPTARLIMDDAFVQGQMYDLGNYPAIVPKSPGQSIGEVWEVSEKTLKRIDQIESHPAYYVREEIPLLGFTSHWKAWAYFLPRDRLPLHATPMLVGNWPKKEGAIHHA